MRITEAARRLNVSAATIKRLERGGFFKAQRDWAGHRRFSENDIQSLHALLFERAVSLASRGRRPS
jgi:DNA-binding transcriptional MerR regulator